MAEINEHPEILLYTRIRKSPYFYASRRHGVQMYAVYNHTYHPRHYGDPVEEYWQLLNGVTLWDVGVERQIEITGPDAFEFTNLLVARDLSKCEVEQCKYVFLCLPDGGIINDPVLLRVEENRFWLSLADSDVELWARGVAHKSDYDVRSRRSTSGRCRSRGPSRRRSWSTCSETASWRSPTTSCALRARRDEGARLAHRVHGRARLRDLPLRGQPERREAVDAVLEAGKPHDLAVIGPCHIRRIEGGILALGADMWYDTNPYEVGMGYDWMVDLEQGSDFIGKEALAQIKREGPKRKLVGVEIGGERLGAYNDGSMIDFFPVHKDGGRIGKVTSACFSPRLEKNIGYAMVPTEHSDLGTELEVERPEGRSLAVVVEKPFIDPKKETPKQELASSTAGAGSSS